MLRKLKNLWITFIKGSVEVKFKMEYELYHHGVKGMKWGVRRYQNKDGSLTAAGKKRAAKYESKYEQLTGKKISGKKSSEPAPQKKTIKDLSDDELRTKVKRLQMEKNYLDLQKQVSNLTPNKVSAGQQFVKNIGEKIITQSLIDTGKSLLTSFLNKQGKKVLGFENSSVDPLDALAKEYKTLNYENQINKLKRELGK